MRSLSGADQEWLLSEMAHAVRTGRPLPETMNELAKANPGTRRGGVAHRISAALSSGLTLNQAVDRAKCFPLGVPEAIASGERGGKLDSVLESLARNIGTETSLRLSILHAVCYPLVVGVVAFTAVLFVQRFIVPQFGQMFKELDVSLPQMTQWILSGALAEAFAALMGFSVLLLLLYILPPQQLPFRAFGDYLRVNVPVVGRVLRRFFLARWCGTMAVLVNAGVPEAQAVRLAGRSTGHAGFESQSEWIAAELEKGRPLAEAMGAKSFFPPMLSWMVGASQKAGGHAAVWPAAQELYRAQGERLSHVTSVVLRVVFLMLAVQMVGVTVTALFLPLIKLMNSLGGS
jgi:type II secretory pathway component PulF